MPPLTADPLYCSLPAFHQLSEADVRHLIMSSAIKSKYARPSADVLVARVRRRTPTLRDMPGEIIAASRPTARLAETRNPPPLCAECRLPLPGCRTIADSL